MHQVPMPVWNEIAKSQPLSQPWATLFRMTPENLPKGLEKMVAAITGKIAYPSLQYLKSENHCVSLHDRIKTIREMYQLDNGANGQEAP